MTIVVIWLWLSSVGSVSPGVNYTLFSPSLSTLSFFDAATPYEIGMKFTSDTNGYIKALRFYKVAKCTGQHVGNLWSSGGSNLATVNFYQNDAAVGWQQAELQTPVPVTANQNYIVSYSAPNGFPAFSIFGFQNNIDNSPLHAPGGGANGLYTPSVGSEPNQVFYNSNYYVDVVFFVPNPTAMPSQPPTPEPSPLPSVRPTCVPSVVPSAAPSVTPSLKPSTAPVLPPSVAPSISPSLKPSTATTLPPSVAPSISPSLKPSTAPILPPSVAPSIAPSLGPISSPSNKPSLMPSFTPSISPTYATTSSPTALASFSPSLAPSGGPQLLPSPAPSTATPSLQPLFSPTAAPSTAPTLTPSFLPSLAPSVAPTLAPSSSPSSTPVVAPSYSPATQSQAPSLSPTLQPTAIPSFTPSSIPSLHPSSIPSSRPSTAQTTAPSTVPSSAPSSTPSLVPSAEPSAMPSSASPTVSIMPSQLPSVLPTEMNQVVAVAGETDAMSLSLIAGIVAAAAAVLILLLIWLLLRHQARDKRRDAIRDLSRQMMAQDCDRVISFRLSDDGHMVYDHEKFAPGAVSSDNPMIYSPRTPRGSSLDSDGVSAVDRGLLMTPIAMLENWEEDSWGIPRDAGDEAEETKGEPSLGAGGTEVEVRPTREFDRSGASDYFTRPSAWAPPNNTPGNNAKSKKSASCVVM